MHDKGIDRLPRFGRLGTCDWLESPVIHRVGDFGPNVIGPLGSLIDPRTDESHRPVTQQLILGRHNRLLIQSGHEVYQGALAALARDYVLSHFTAFKGQFLYVDAVVALLLFGAMTFDAVFLKHRPDFLFEIDLVLGRRRQFFNINGVNRSNENWRTNKQKSRNQIHCQLCPSQS